MFGRLRKGGALAAALALALVGVGASPALAADGDVIPSEPEQAKLTKVIVGPENTDGSADTYTFHFAGNGVVTEDGDSLLSGAKGEQVEQDARTIQVGDEVPRISDVTLTGAQLTTTTSRTNGQSFQTVVQKPLSEILAGVEFPHAGVYTYRVTESSTSTALGDTGYYINQSRAAYILRVRVENDGAGDTSTNDSKTHVGDVTLDRVLDDDGRAVEMDKVDPTYPKADANGKITDERPGKTLPADEMAGDTPDRGRDVYGFTFGNEYVKGGEFVVKKLVSGTYADKTKLFHVKLTVHDETAMSGSAQGACLTYVIEGGGVDQTESNLLNDGSHKRLDYIYNAPQVADNIAEFDPATGNATIEADLKEGSSIRVTGVFGPYAVDYEPDVAHGEDPNDRRKTVSSLGILQGETFTVIEETPGNYVPTGYVYEGDDADFDPRTDDLTGVFVRDAEDGKLSMAREATGSATTAFVVNTLDDSFASPTGILINNLPYILMIGIPVAVFAVMFVSKRRRNAAA